MSGMLTMVKPMSLVMTRTNVPPDPTDAWDINAIYAFEEEVKHNDAIWSSSLEVGDNQGNEPSATSTVWVYKQAVNELAYGDKKITTKTINPDTVDMTFTKLPRMTYIGIVNIDAVSVTIQVLDAGDNELFSYTGQTKTRTLYTCSDFWLAEYEQRRSVFTPLPFTAPGAKIRVLIDNTGQDAAVGVIAAGKPYYLAQTKIDAESQIIDFSIDQTDKFGNTELIKGESSKLFWVNGIVDSKKYDYVLNTLEENRATLTLIIAESRLEALSVYGKYDDFKLKFGELTSALSFNGREVI